MAKYRKKPVVIDAMRWTGCNWDEIVQWATAPAINIGHLLGYDPKDDNPAITVHTMEGAIFASVGDWIIRGTIGEAYPCKPDIFDNIYEAVEHS